MAEIAIPFNLLERRQCDRKAISNLQILNRDEDLR